MDFLDERRAVTHVRAKAIREKATISYNQKIIPCKFDIDDLILQCANVDVLEPGGKLAPN